MFFDIRIYDREKDAIEKLSLLLNSKNSETKKTLSNLLGLRISKNGFGVKPYGDLDGVQDWLGLGQKRVQDPGKNIGPNLILGYVYLFSPNNDGLKENIESISEGEIVRFVDGTNAKKIIYQISRKENRITELKLLFVLNDSKQGYDVHFSLDGDGDHSTRKIKGQISNWPKLKSIIEEETK